MSRNAQQNSTSTAQDRTEQDKTTHYKTRQDSIGTGKGVKTVF